MIINNSVSSETGVTPFEAIFGKPDEAYLKTILPPAEDPPMDMSAASAKYLSELWAIQRDITARSVKFQMDLHDKRVAKTPWEYQKKYQKGDYVLKLRDEVLKTNKLYRYKYLGPYQVDKHEIGSNFVYCTHVSSRQEYVFPIDKLIPFFCTSNDEALNVAKLDHQSFLMMDVKFHKGNPAVRSSMEFLIRFEDDSIDEYKWYPYTSDLITTEALIEYCRVRPELQLLLGTQKEENIHLRNLRKQKITNVTPGDIVYLDLRLWSYGSSWFDDLGLPESDTKLYLVKGQYQNAFLSDGRKIDLYVPIFAQMGDKSHALLSVDNAFIFQFGRNTTYDPSNSYIVDEELIAKFPALKNSGQQLEQEI
jgi:hypothetical protein